MVQVAIVSSGAQIEFPGQVIGFRDVVFDAVGHNRSHREIQGGDELADGFQIVLVPEQEITQEIVGFGVFKFRRRKEVLQLFGRDGGITGVEQFQPLQIRIDGNIWIL